MSIRVIKAGLQTTIQASPRAGLRHLGVPGAGAADPLSMALANRLVGNAGLTAALEVSLSGLELEALQGVAIAITGADAECLVNEQSIDQHCTVNVQQGDIVRIAPPVLGARVYVAFAGGLQADKFLQSEATYLPAGFGGHQGRALTDSDELNLLAPAQRPMVRTPDNFQLQMRRAWTVRASSGAEATLLDVADQLYSGSFKVSGRSDRMGIRLDGEPLKIQSSGRMQSAAAFPGVVQCPEDGRPYILGVDAQTTGGYPRIAKVARLDLHILGQMRPGDQVRFLLRDDATAADELRQKHDFWRPWIGDIESVI